MPISLFIHHDPKSQSWVIPYLEQRKLVLNKYTHIEIIGSEFERAYRNAAYYFKISDIQEVGVTIKSDWIRCHYLLTHPELLYSDSDVFWKSTPDVGEEPLKGDSTFGIVWSGKGLSEESLTYAFTRAKETNMTGLIHSSSFLPRVNKINPSHFYHGKINPNL